MKGNTNQKTPTGGLENLSLLLRPFAAQILTLRGRRNKVMKYMARLSGAASAGQQLQFQLAKADNLLPILL